MMNGGEKGMKKQTVMGANEDERIFDGEKVWVLRRVRRMESELANHLTRFQNSRWRWTGEVEREEKEGEIDEAVSESCLVLEL